MSSCFVVQLARCIPWVTDLNQIAVYQFTEPANGTMQTNVTFFLVYPQNGELDEPSTERMLREVNDGQLNCVSLGIDGIRAATTDLPADPEDQSMSTLGVLFGFFVVFCVLAAFIMLVLRKRKSIARGSEVGNFVKQLEDLPDEELACVYTKNKALEEEERLEREEERRLAEEEERLIAEEEEAAAAHQRRTETGVEFGEDVSDQQQHHRDAADTEGGAGGGGAALDAPLLQSRGGIDGDVICVPDAATASNGEGGEEGSGTASTNDVDVDDIDVLSAVALPPTVARRPQAAGTGDSSSTAAGSAAVTVAESPADKAAAFRARHGGIDIDEI